MKIVEWTEGNAPDVLMHDGDAIVIEDCLWWDDLCVGDMIQYVTKEFGTACFRVTDVEPGNPDSYPRGINLVTIIGAV